MTVNRGIETSHTGIFDPGQVGRIRADPAVLERFYLAFYDEILRYLARRVSDPHDVADLVADTFVAAIDAAASFDHRRGQVLAWLIGIARNKLRRWHRDRGSNQDLARRVIGRRVLDDDDIGELEARIDAAAMAPFEALSQLTPDQQEIIDLVEIQGLTPAELAYVLGVPAGVARIRLYRARKALRQQLSERRNR